MKIVFALLAMVSSPLFLFSGTPGPDLVADLKCENRAEARGVSVVRPTFSWENVSNRRGWMQKAYQIAVGSTAKGLSSGSADIWDSGVREGSQSTFVKYDGPELRPGTEYFWKVRSYDQRLNPSEWSEVASFVTELAEAADWDGAKWIGYEELPPDLKLVPGVHTDGSGLGQKALARPVIPYLRKEFELEDTVKKAFVFVSGMGHYELRINGRKVGDSFLAPGWTNYERTRLYNTYDVTSMLQKGRNTIGAMLGTGFFNINRERYRKMVVTFGMPMMILKLGVEYGSGRRISITTGGDWKTHASPITFSSIYGGEDYDARLEMPGWDNPAFDDSNWANVLEVNGSEAALKPEKDYPLKVTGEIEPRKVSERKTGVYVYDFGQNLSGIVRISVLGARGAQVKIIPGELLDRNGYVTQQASGGPYYFLYTLKGGGEEEWSPVFSYYGFRYAQIEGAVPISAAGPAGLPRVTNIRMLHTRNSSPNVGTFQCSNSLLNQVFDLIDAAIRSNLASVPTDCPHREKLGWLETPYLMCGSIQYNYDIHNLYAKLLGDMGDSQLPDGLVPNFCPEYAPSSGAFRDSPEWGSAAITIPWLLYKYYGDREIIERSYPVMTRYAAYLESRSVNGILSYGLGDWFDLGPKLPGPSQLTPIPLTATASYYNDLSLLSRMAALLGRNEDSAKYKVLADQVSESLNRLFFNRALMTYATGSQTSMSMPLSLGIVDPRYRPAVFENLVRSIEQGGNALTAGDIGFRYLVDALSSGNAHELIFRMNSRSDVPGYGYQISKGATALTESWAALDLVSNNHMMLGHLMEWFYSGLAGIRQSEDSTGFEKIIIDPHPVGDVWWASATYHSVHGQISAAWNQNRNKFVLDVTIPANTRAVIFIPANSESEIRINGRPLFNGNDDGLKYLGMENGRASIEVSSGQYHLISNWSRNSHGLSWILLAFSAGVVVILVVGCVYVRRPWRL